MRLHVLGSKAHKWLAIVVGVQVLFWMGTGTLMSLLDNVAVRSEHFVSRVPEALPTDAKLPAWLDRDENVVSVTMRALDGEPVIEILRLDGSVSLHDPSTGRRLSPI